MVVGSNYSSIRLVEVVQKHAKKRPEGSARCTTA